MKPREIFLSHASADRKAADTVAQALRQAGLKVWYSKSHLKGAQQWHDEIGRALKRCDWFLLLLSPPAVKSRWVKLELTYAINQARYTERIMPVMLKPCDYEALSWTLGSIQTIDATAGLETAIATLLSLWSDKRSRKPKMNIEPRSGRKKKV